MLRIVGTVHSLIILVFQVLAQRSLNIAKITYNAIMHPEILSELKRVTVKLVYFKLLCSCPDVSKNTRRCCLWSNTAQILIRPGRGYTCKKTRVCTYFRYIPSEAKAVTIERFPPLSGMRTLIDERVGRISHEVREQYLFSFVSDKSTHIRFLNWFF